MGAGLAGIALGGVVAHAIATNIRKHKMIKGDMGEDYSVNNEDTEITLSQISEDVKKLKEKDDVDKINDDENTKPQ